MTRVILRSFVVLALAALVPASASAQAPGTAPVGTAVQQPATAAPVATQVPPPAGDPAAAATAASTDPTYTIGPDDVLSVLLWRDKEASTDVRVRPDGMITLPLLNDVRAAGLTPDQLRVNLQKAYEKYFQDPNVSVVVKDVNSRKVFVTGAVAKPGAYLLTGRTTILQMLAQAGGLGDFAKKSKIAVMRTENGQTQRYPFDYDDVIEGKKLEQNIELRPGDTLIVP